MKRMKKWGSKANKENTEWGIKRLSTVDAHKMPRQQRDKAASMLRLAAYKVGERGKKMQEEPQKYHRQSLSEKQSFEYQPLRFPPINQKHSFLSAKSITQPEEAREANALKTIDEEIQKLENLTKRCSCLRKDWHGIQKDILTMSFKKMLQSKEMKSIAEFA